jgi:hypothetical protein
VALVIVIAGAVLVPVAGVAAGKLVPPPAGFTFDQEQPPTVICDTFVQAKVAVLLPAVGFTNPHNSTCPEPVVALEIFVID